MWADDVIILGSVNSDKADEGFDKAITETTCVRRSNSYRSYSWQYHRIR